MIRAAAAIELDKALADCNHALQINPGSAADIDVVWLHGYGFPRHRGGPMYHADQLGLAAVRDAILRYQAEHGAQYWAVAPVLESLAAAGGTFGSWSPALPEAA